MLSLCGCEHGVGDACSTQVYVVRIYAIALGFIPDPGKARVTVPVVSEIASVV